VYLSRQSCRFYLTSRRIIPVWLPFIPSGEGATIYDVYYGDGTESFVKVGAGKNTQHTYKEGVYTVKIVAHGIGGKTTELSQELTVSFKAPENLKTTSLPMA
jgi:PKD repeat protein